MRLVEPHSTAKIRCAVWKDIKIKRRRTSGVQRYAQELFEWPNHDPLYIIQLHRDKKKHYFEYIKKKDWKTQQKYRRSLTISLMRSTWHAACVCRPLQAVSCLGWRTKHCWYSLSIYGVMEMCVKQFEKCFVDKNDGRKTSCPSDGGHFCLGDLRRISTSAVIYSFFQMSASLDGRES